MGTWGTDLWDCRDVIEKHTHSGIDFLERCASFMKDRIRIEQDYAKSLRRLVKQYQFRKKDEDNLSFTYQHSFKSFLKETDDFAGQREVIAEEIQNSVLKEMHKLALESKAERKKAMQTLNEHKSHLEQLSKVLQVAKRKYDQASEDAHNALKAYEQANEGCDFTKAQILKCQKTSQEKGHIAEKAVDEYMLAMDNFNKAQTLFYEADLPNTVNNELQKPEENRIKSLNGFFCKVAEIQKRVLPIITKCLDEMIGAGNTCNPGKDSLTLIDIYKTGEHPPGNLAFEEWGKTGAGNANSLVAPSPLTKSRLKSNKSVFAMSSKKKDLITNETVANDFSDLPPAQRRKKFNKTINNLEEQISQHEKTRKGLSKIADTSKQFGGDMATIQGQIEANLKETERLKGLLHQYNCYLSAMDGHDNKRRESATPSVDFPPPPVQKQPELVQQQQIAPQSPDFTQGEFDDELRCTVLYDFSGNNEGEMTAYIGEELVIVEEDDGSGWTRVMRGEEEGYIPTSYVRQI